MDVSKSKKKSLSKDPERVKLLQDKSHLSTIETNYYGSTPTSLKIPNVNSISDLNEIERACNSYSSSSCEISKVSDCKSSNKFSQSLNIKRSDKNSQLEACSSTGNEKFRSDSKTLGANAGFDVSQLSSSIKTKASDQIKNFVAGSRIRLNSYDSHETNSLYHYMQEHRKLQNSQIYESLDYEINENMLYLMEKKRNLRLKQKQSIFCKYLRSYFPSQKEASRWFIIFLIGSFTALTACFIKVNVEYFTEKKFEYLRDLFNVDLTKNNVVATNGTNQNSTSFLNSTIALMDNDEYSFQNLRFDKSALKNRFFKLQIPMLFWILTNAIPTFLGSALVTYLAPVSAGSGIPVIKCYLNGVKVPEVVRIKTYIAKMFGVIFTVLGGLFSGKEGPLIHCGSVIAAGLSQGKSTTLKLDFKIFRHFREDHEKRDFVSAGAASGVSSAFGAPVGGVLFSLEEGSSYWNQILTWRIFFCSLISAFTLNLITSAISSQGGKMSFSGLINFGKFDSINYNVMEIPLFILVGCLGGLVGALFNGINHKLTVFRMKYITKRPLKVLEAVFVAILTAFFGFVLILVSDECKSLEDLKTDNKIKYPLQLDCKDNEFSTMASLFLSNSETTVINMFHLNGQLYSIATLTIFLGVYFLLSVVTYGLSVSSGIFIPALLIGSIIGRMIGLFTSSIASSWFDCLFKIDDWVSKYALLGAAAVLGGITRMTISLTVILIETTGNLTLGLPLMICLIFAKFVGDTMNEGIYDIHIKLQQIPFLHCEPHLNKTEIDEDESIFVQQIMNTPVVTLNRIETVSNIIQILQNETHYGFPVVDTNRPLENWNPLSQTSNESFNEAPDEINKVIADYRNLDELKEEPNETVILTDYYINRMKMNRAIGHYGRLRGIVLRWQLIVLLQKKIFNDNILSNQAQLTSDLFRDAYPRYESIKKVIPTLTDDELDAKIDLSFVMNPSPYSVPYNCSYERTFRLFRALGLRHLCVTDDLNNVVGIVTRKDMLHFKVITHKNKRYIQKYSETLMRSETN